MENPYCSCKLTRVRCRERRAEEAEKAAAKASRVVRPAPTLERTVSPPSTPAAAEAPAASPSRPAVDPPESSCIKRGATLKMWPSRYIKVDQQTGGLKIYESKRKQGQVAPRCKIKDTDCVPTEVALITSGCG